MNEPKKRPCRFLLAGKCTYGAKCKWSHDMTMINNIPASGRNLIDWTGKLHSPRPLGHNVGAFFRQAQALLEADVTARQEIISSLATDKGCAKMEELFNIDWTRLHDQGFVNRFGSDFIPLLQVVTDHRIISSGVLEAHTGIIFNFLFGRGGQRGKRIFEICLDYLDKARAVGEAIGPNLVMTTLLFSLVVQTAQNARITPAYQNIFDRLVATAEHPDNTNTHADIHASRRHLREAAVSLEHGKDVPFLQQQITRSGQPQTTTFHLARAGPGEHGDSPARHDNDKEDIQDIQILPTYQEIVSTQPEYLPLLDADTWHKAGVQGLLDRNFRLLREDTIGQLRDTVRTELDRVNQQEDADGSKLHRHWSLDNVSIEAPYFDAYRGLEVVAAFDQPEHIHDMTLKERKTHWEHSRRLQPDSVVCLLTPHGKLIFCHVTREFRDTHGKKKAEDDRFPPPSRASVSLVDNPRRASVLLRPVDLGSRSVEDLIYVHALGDLAGNCTLVEFPGVLLPAFMPTLQALQALSKSGTVPFSEFLTSTERGDQQVMSPPVYATLPNFSFDLNVICADGKTMAVDPNNITTTSRRQLTDSSHLDPSQSQTLLDALSRRLALLQGPPGTGKSFVGVHLARVLVAAKNSAALGPIICVCYTNHALDQLLEHLLDNGITQVIRMGSASKSERISKLNIRDLAKKDDVTKVEKHEMWKTRVAMEGQAGNINTALQQLHGCGTAHGLKHFLQSFNPNHATQLFGAEKTDSDWEEQKSKKHKSPQRRLRTWLNGGRKPGPHTTDRTEDELLNVDLSDMSHQERACIHQAWIKTMFDQGYEAIEPARAAFVAARDRLQIVRSELDLRVLEQADIIGLTTSGLARNLPTLRKLSSKVLLCEEAGEVLEAHLLTALMPQIEHAILIGDHLQLRPHVQYQLSRESREGEKYSLDLSLFERLVNQGEETGFNVPYSTLHTQRRMHPAIAELVRSTLYPSLIDEPPAYAPVQGMQKRLFWFDHDNHEDSNHGPGGTHASHSNDFEVEMVTALVSHLIKQGQRGPDEIAVLTPYLGQLRKLRASLSGLFELMVDDRDEEDLERAGLADAPTTSLISKTSLAQAVRVATVDNFQGEEAPIVVISLVRSNERHQCGFLKTSNRINVLLSRAQQGMYIIGDAATCAGVPMWKNVIDIMDANDNIGHTLPIECPRHEEHKMEVETPDDFLRLAPDGPSLCGERCPPAELCQDCCDEDIKETQVDLIMFSTYSEIDLDDTPCIFLPCGHILTVESMDGLVGLANYYEIGVDGHPTAVRDLPYALDIDQAKVNCPTCRKSLRNTARYGRPIRSALLIQSTLKFITWSNTGYVNLLNEFLDLKAELAAMHDFSTITPTDLDLKGGNDAMVKIISQLPGSHRYQRIVKFRKNLSKFAHQVQQSEQPFRKVQDLVNFANRRKASDDQVQFSFPASSVLQTKSSRMAACLILRSDLLIITDYLTIHRNSPGSSKTSRTIDTSVGRKRCEELITICASGKHPMQEAECHLFLAQFAAIEVNFSSAVGAEDTTAVKENWDDEHPLRQMARFHLDAAHAIHAALPAETKALAADLELTEKMLTDGVFYSDVSDEEIRAVVSAMEREFRSTGHWYRCPNGHPFTVGECGGPMQLARCSECGAEVGGQHHVAAEGVTRAGDLGEIERGVQRMGIQG
ncbi:hypothetical protein KVT40_002184 [Elsinoe batatas]|uniref:NFX1-type zinc finger-containing protein 1 n=1 Tax=Elsinoe batatas TaxID=2601811 RepID=A0A8K0LAK8_9PEZI|nr:hypothetical protein KVT40_002184 [Elsinoe batatas]